MLNRIISYLSDFFIFLLVFSLFNDSFIVNHFGENSLKIPFLILFVFAGRLINNFKSMTATQDKLFFTFWLSSFLLLLTQMFVGYDVDFTPAGTMLIANLMLTLFFVRYPIKKTVYFIWFSMVVSIIICYFSQPLDEWTFRKTGGTEDANEFAMQVIIFIIASFYLFTHNRSKLLLALSIVFFFYALFAAGSKSAFLVVGIIGGLSIIRLIILYPKFFISLKAVILILALLGAATQINPKKIEAVNNMIERSKNNGTALMRIHAWTAGKHMVENNPLFGVGVDAFVQNEKKYEEGHMIGSAPAPHNVFVKLVAESGIPIFILFMVFIIYILVTDLKKKFYSDGWYIVLMPFSAFLMGLSIGVTYDKHFWLYMILLMNLNYQLKKMKEIE